MNSPSAGGMKVLRGAASDARPVVHEQRSLADAADLLNEAQTLSASIVESGRAR